MLTTKMLNTKRILNLSVQKIIGFRAKVSSASASDVEIKETAEFYGKIASKYQASNDLLTFGLLRTWRNTLANHVEIDENTKILDAAAGTGLNTMKILDKSKHFKSNSDFRITMLDINPHMMNIGRDNFKKLGYNDGFVNFLEGDLHNLPFDDGSFGVVILSLANRPYIDFGLVLKEINRVLKSQGKIIILEFCFSQNPTIVQRMYCNYIQFIASSIEKLVLGNLRTAEFVAQSIREVVARTNVQESLSNANFQKIEFKSLSLGIAGLTIGYKK